VPWLGGAEPVTSQFNNKTDKDLVEALFKPDIYKFGDNKADDWEDVKDYDI
jgi:hypothetical protein